MIFWSIFSQGLNFLFKLSGFRTNKTDSYKKMRKKKIINDCHKACSRRIEHIDIDSQLLLLLLILLGEYCF